MPEILFTSGLGFISGHFFWHLFKVPKHWNRLPGVSLRSTPGYSLASFQDAPRSMLPGKTCILPLDGNPRLWQMKRMSCKLQFCRRWAFLIFILGGSINAYSETGVAVSGHFNVTHYSFVKREPKIWPAMSSTNEFRALFNSSGQWLLEIRPASNTNDVFYLSFDGTNSFYIAYLQKTRGKFGKDGRPEIVDAPIENKTNYSRINSGEFPLIGSDEQFRCNCLWLCLASGHYIKSSQGDSMPLPWLDPSRDLVAYGFQLNYELMTDPPYAPVHLAFVRSAKLDFASLADELKRPFFRAARDEGDMVEWNKLWDERKKFFNEGFMVGELQSEGTTNKNGFTFPLSFEFKVFYPNRDGEPVLNQRYDGEITSISDISPSDSFVPPIIAPLAVQDQRFRYRSSSRGIDRIDYILQPSDQWPAQDSPHLKLLFSKALADKQASALYQPKAVRIRRMIMSVSVVVFGIALLVLLHMKGNTGKRQKK